MPQALTELFAADPSYAYALVAVLFVLCGLGLPLPEEIVLVSGGYLCYQGHADFAIMVVVCAGAILVGDIVPFLLGSYFGPRLLRLRWLRFVINRNRLAMFDRWFRRRGDMVILIARFIPGLRVVAFFTGGTMRMRWRRFLVLDACGITLTAPTFIFVGWHFGDEIHETFRRVQQVEDGILYLAIALGLGFATWYSLRSRARRKVSAGPRETWVEPSRQRADATTGSEEASAPASGAGAPGIEIPVPEEPGTTPPELREYAEQPPDEHAAGTRTKRPGSSEGDR